MVTMKLGALVALLAAALTIQLQRQPSPDDRDSQSCQAEVKKLRDQLAGQRREYKELEGRFSECQTANRELRSKLGQAGRGDGDERPTQDCRRVEARLKECESARDKLAKENRDLSNKLAQAGRGDGDERLRQDYKNLRQEFKNLEGRFDECQNARNNLATLNRDLNNKLSQGTSGPSREFEERLRTAQETANRYRTQNAALVREKDQLAGQLADLGRRRDELDRQLQTANLNLQQSRDEVARLSGSTASQRSGDSRSATGESSSQSGENDQSSVRPASHNVGAILLRSKTSNPQPQKESETTSWSYEEGGKRHVIRELVIGTLELTYETSIAPGTKVPMEATFTPHPILQRAPNQATVDPILWYIELRFESTRITGNYNKGRSGKPQQRELNPQGGKETWDWELVAPEDFNQDKSAVIVDAGYKEPGSEKEWLPDIAREPLVLSEKETPGAFAVAFRLLKENLTYALGIVSVIFGIWATYVSVKKGRLEVRLKEMELQPKG
jgi:hypothetical protein